MNRIGKTDVIVGIDPDVEKSGVAARKWIEDQKRFHWALHNMSFFDLLEYLKTVQPKLVVIEAGFLNKGNWRKKVKSSIAANAKIGERVGANHEVGRKIVEMIKYLDLPYQLVRPTKSKLDHQSFKKLTKINVNRSNQEQRDAAMLIFGK